MCSGGRDFSRCPGSTMECSSHLEILLHPGLEAERLGEVEAHTDQSWRRLGRCRAHSL